MFIYFERLLDSFAFYY